MSESVDTRSTYCRICEAACGLTARVEDGRLIELTPDRTHPVSAGFACAKGTRFGEVAYDPERLLTPMIRNQAGALHSSTWDRANALVVRRIREIQSQHGPHAVGVYFGNPVAFNVQAAAALPAFTKLLGTRNVFSAGSQDCNNKFAGARIVYGSPIVQPFPDIDRTELAIVFGSNPYVSQGSFVHLAGGSLAFQRLVDRGGHVVWIDPVKTESAARWGEHQPIRPGTDAFLLCALLGLLASDQPALPHGLRELADRARSIPLSRVAQETGISVSQIRALADIIRAADSTALHISVGVNQGGHGTLCFVLLQAIAHATGNFGRAGGLLVHPLSRWMGKAFEKAGLDEVRHSRVGAFASNMGTLPAALMADEIHTDGPDKIRALIVIAGDPAVSVPGGSNLEDALASLDLLVCIDMFENTTGKLANVLLPSTTWLERWDVATTSLQFQRHGLVPAAGAVIRPRGAARNDARILCDLALGLGGSKAFRLGTLGWDRWLPNIQHGIPYPKARASHGAELTPRFWSSEIEAELARLVARRSSDGWRLLCRRRRLGHNSWLHAGARRSPDDVAWLSPKDFQGLGLRPDEIIKISSRVGSIAIRAREKAALPRRTVVVPHGLSAANVNALFPTDADAIERMSGMVTLTGLEVEVQAIDNRTNRGATA